MKRKILFINSEFFSVSMGGIRSRRLVAGLMEQGHEVFVLSRPSDDAAVVPATDYLLVRGLRPLLKRQGRKKGKKEESGNSATPSSSPKSGLSRNITLTTFINRWVMIPDKQIGWYLPAMRKATAFLKENSVDVIFSTLAPRTNHLVGATLSEKLKIPLVLEYRDLWSGSPYPQLKFPTRLHEKIHCALERAVLQRAHVISAVSVGIGRYLKEIYGDVFAAPIEINYNWFTPAEYPEVSAKEKKKKPFVISYIGAMYPGRHPGTFFQGLRAFVDKHRLTPEQVEFRWVGAAFALPGMEQILDELSLNEYINVRGRVSHKDALQELISSDVSLILQAPNDEIHIPGKLFEAMGAKTPILMLANDCEGADIMEKARAGVACTYNSDAVVRGLETLYETAISGEEWPYNEEERLKVGEKQVLEGYLATIEKAIATAQETF